MFTTNSKLSKAPQLAKATVFQPQVIELWLQKNQVGVSQKINAGIEKFGCWNLYG